ncbi:restriction endonuclease subunit S [Bacteroides fragilis]|nr:restriction endonuclease subunit S [Bacteroides fragilis]
MDTKTLRQKILDLAIHGKLVPQDPNDEPASVLLERIKVEKERLIKEGKIKRSKKSAKTSDTPHYENVPFEVPESWVWCRLEDIAYIASGSTPDKTCFVKEGIPYIKMYNLRNQEIDFDYQPQYITEEIHNSKLQRSRTEVGDLIMNIVGPPLGKLAVIPATLPQANFNQAAVLIRPYKYKEDLVLYLKSYLEEMSEINSIATRGSAGQVNISLTQSQNMRIPLPPLAEQQRIIAEISKWFALINQIEQGKIDLQTIIKQTKSKILDLAIHGKLVPQDPNDEPAIELLKRINPDFTPCDNGHSEKLPQGWSITELTNLADIKNGYAFKSSNYISSNGVRLIRIANVQDGYIEDKMPQFYPFDKMKALKDFMLTEGDILMSLTGNVGRVGILTNELLPAALNQRVACIKEHPNIIAKKFLFYTFQTSNFSKDCVKSGKGVAQLNISTEWLKHYFILIPPLTEQQRIVQKIEELFSVLDNIQNALEV